MTMRWVVHFQIYGSEAAFSRAFSWAQTALFEMSPDAVGLWDAMETRVRRHYITLHQLIQRPVRFEQGRLYWEGCAIAIKWQSLPAHR